MDYYTFAAHAVDKPNIKIGFPYSRLGAAKSYIRNRRRARCSIKETGGIRDAECKRICRAVFGGMSVGGKLAWALTLQWYRERAALFAGLPSIWRQICTPSFSDPTGRSGKMQVRGPVSSLELSRDPYTPSRNTAARYVSITEYARWNTWACSSTAWTS